VIGSDVWIAGNAVVLSGVTIGDGAVVGAGSVVIDDVPPYGIVFGNPARLFGRRFADELVAELLELRWWDLDHQQVQSLRPLLLGTNIELFIDQCRKLKGLPPLKRRAVAAKASVKPAAPDVTARKIPEVGNCLTEGEIRDWCVGFLAKELKVPPIQIDSDTKFTRMGIDSTTSIIFSVDLGDWLGFELPANIMFDYPTINDLAHHLAQQQAGYRLDRRAS
jgi:acyl carrier protein